MTSGGPGGTSGDRDDLIFFAIMVAVMAVVLVFNTLNVLHEWRGTGQPLESWEPLVWEGSSILVLMALGPLVLIFTRRVWPLDPPFARKLALHLAAAAGISLVHVAATGALRWAVYAALDRDYDPLGPLSNWPYEFRKDVLVYAALAGLYVGWRLLRARGPELDETAATLEVRDGARRRFVALADVAWVEAAGNYVELHRQGEPVLHRASLTAMAQRLERAGFVRIHRSRLVRRDAINEVVSKTSGDFVVRLRDGRELAGSRRYRRPLLAD